MLAQLQLPFTVIAATVVLASLVIAQDASDESAAIARIEQLARKVERDENLPGPLVIHIAMTHVMLRHLT